MSVKYVDVSKFEDNLVDSYHKLSFIYLSLNSVREEDYLIQKSYAQHINRTIKSILDDLKSANEIYSDTKLSEKMKKLRKKEIDIEME